MKRVLLAALLASPLALARAEADAYANLAGMAASAKTDKGPDAGEPPKDAPVRPARETAEARRARREAREGLIVSADVSAAPRVWTRFFASLLPSARPAAWELAVSTRSARRPVSYSLKRR